MRPERKNPLNRVLHNNIWWTLLFACLDNNIFQKLVLKDLWELRIKKQSLSRSLGENVHLLEKVLPHSGWRRWQIWTVDIKLGQWNQKLLTLNFWVFPFLRFLAECLQVWLAVIGFTKVEGFWVTCICFHQSINLVLWAAATNMETQKPLSTPFLLFRLTKGEGELVGGFPGGNLLRKDNGLWAPGKTPGCHSIHTKLAWGELEKGILWQFFHIGDTVGVLPKKKEKSEKGRH